MPSQHKQDDFIPTRASLLNRLKDWQDQDTWTEFFSIYRRLIFGTALKAGLTEQEAEDVLQETVLSVAKTIKDFKYDRGKCAFKTWLRHLTRKRIADAYRKRAKQPVADEAREDDEATPLVERVPDPKSLDLDRVWEEEWEHKLFDAAIERVKRQASPEQFQIFDLYVLKNMPVGKVAAALDTSVAQVYLAKHRVSKLIKKEVQFLEGRMA